ncbi:hypothetical protein [Helicobacter sp. MIT 01-3238]|uniref:hypothetical protein n=1 Tax=Helicobacter sp. MIT 01-3238 TaxID=398627 RepID=UPI000E1F4351|nr:hypothetical protein [Helicobacter sp. MIT 01-3238]RDU52913.1 hypothetical protein CQA40_06320 [Helicobacter sp. MIT 01-3238]
MEKILKTLQEYKEKFLKKLEQDKNLKLYLALAGALLLFGGAVYLLLGLGEPKEIDMLAPPPQEQEEQEEEGSTENLELDEKALRESKKAPTLDQQLDKIEKDLKAAEQGISTNNMIVVKQEFNETPPPLDDTTLANRDRDIRAYLKSIQGNIILNADSFRYKDKDYKVGESFEGYQIMSINPIYVRFADNITALHYNLRFIEEAQ